MIICAKQSCKERLKVQVIEVTQKKTWIDNIIRWTEKDVNCLLKYVHERDDWRNCVTLASLIPPTIYDSRDNKY